MSKVHVDPNGTPPVTVSMEVFDHITTVADCQEEFDKLVESNGAEDPKTIACEAKLAELLMLESGHPRLVSAVRLEPRRRRGRRGVGLHQLDLDADEGEQELRELPFRPER